jgi:hypothetical protein
MREVSHGRTLDHPGGDRGRVLALRIVRIAIDTSFRFRGKRTVGCPETGLVAQVEIDA